MRLRVQTFAPLPEFKAWFIPDNPIPPLTIRDLKKALLTRIPQLKGARIRSQDVCLLLDEFELLNDSPFSAVRDGDLICMRSVLSTLGAQKNDHEVKLTKKRKRAPSMDEPRPARDRVALSKKRRKHSSRIPDPSTSDDMDLNVSGISSITSLSSLSKLSKLSKLESRLPTLESISSSSSPSSSSSSSSSSSTPSTSSSSSSTSTSTSSSSSTSTSSTPSLLSSKYPLRKPSGRNFLVKASTTTNQNFTPPGYGKPSTQNRNRRRRLKHKYERQQAAAGPSAPKGASAPNLVPLGPSKVQEQDGHADSSMGNSALPSNTSNSDEVPPSTSTTIDQNTAPASTEPGTGDHWSNHHNGGQVLMASLRNKNKKKGFKQSITSEVPKKIIFDESVNKPPPFSVASSSATPAPPAEASYDYASRPRLIPPSELQEMRKIPSNMFVTSIDVEEGMWEKKKGKKKSKRKDAERYQAGEWGSEWYDESHACVDMGVEEETVAVLPYSEEDVVAGELGAGANGNGFDWDKAEKVWEKGAEVSMAEQLKTDQLVGWMALDINPRTFSPEILLKVARITRVQDTNGSHTVSVRPLLRHAEGEAALSFGVGVSDEGEIEDEEVDHDWADVLNSKWRLLTV